MGVKIKAREEIMDEARTQGEVWRAWRESGPENKRAEQKNTVK